LARPAAILFDLGGVLLPFDRERRVSAIARRLGVGADAVRAIFAGDLPRRMDLGEADEGDFASAFAALAGRPVRVDEARELILGVFEPPNTALWRLAEALRAHAVVGGFSDNPAFVRAVFPAGGTLDPMIFSAEIRAAKPSDAAFAAAEARLGLAGDDILFIDDSAANVGAAKRRGWDAILFQSNDQIAAALAERGLA
jgi:HAD superfamily hydrolase (TIGR01509 family)